MKKISFFLEKFSALAPPDKTLSKEIRRIISRETGVRVNEESVEIRNGTVFLDIPAVEKSEVKLNKERLLREIRAISGKAKITDIV